MTNPFYSPTGQPAPNSRGLSALLRAEFELIKAGFDLFPALAGNAGLPIRVNMAESGFDVLTALDGIPIGATTRSTGAFTAVAVSADVRAANFTINAQDATDLGTYGWYNSAGPGISMYGNSVATYGGQLWLNAPTHLGVLKILTDGSATFASTLRAAGELRTAAGINAQSGQTTAMNTATANLGGITVEGAGASAGAFMAFVRAGVFGGYFGVDTDNNWKVGGWSLGAAAYTLLHENNFANYALNRTASNATGALGVSITGNAATATNAAASVVSARATLLDYFPGRTDSADYPVAWASGTSTTPAYSCAAVTIRSDIGRLQATNLTATAAVYAGTTVTAGGLLKGNGGGSGLGAITISSSAPSGGVDGDLWFQT